MEKLLRYILKQRRLIQLTTNSSILMWVVMSFVYFSPVAWAACTSPAGVAATIERFDAESTMKYCDGTNWQPLGVSGDAGAGNANPTVLANFNRFFNVRTLRLSGNYLYFVAKTSDTFGVIDITTPTAVTMHGVFVDKDRMGDPQDMVLQGNYAYVVTRESDNLVVIDITDPADPSILSTFSPATPLTNLDAVAVAGNYVYMLGDNSGLQIIDVSTPTVPVERGSVYNASTMSSAGDLLVTGNYAYISSSGGSNEVVVIDISDPDNPIEKGNVSFSDDSNYMAFDGTDLYVRTTDAYIHSVDVSDPDNPAVLDSFDLSGIESGGWDTASEIIYDSSYLYVYKSGDFAVLDVTDSSNIALQGSLLSGSNGLHTPAAALDAANNNWYTAGTTLSITDVSDTTNMDWFESHLRVQLPSVALGGEGTITTRPYGNLIFTINWDSATAVNTTTVYVSDFSDPLNPIERGSVVVNPMSQFKGSHFQDPYLYLVGTKGNDFAIVDISDPDNPVEVSNPDIGGQNRVKASGNHVYMMNTADLFSIYDVSTPATPSLRSSVTLPSFVNSNGGEDIQLDMARNYAYVSADDSVTGDGIVSVIDISDLDNPVEVDSITFTDVQSRACMLLDQANNVLYFNGSDGGDRMTAIDVSDPTNLVALGEFDTSAASYGCPDKNDDDYLFVPTYGGLKVFDVSDPTNMTQLYYVEDTALEFSAGSTFTLSGNYIFSSLGSVSTTVVDPGTNYGAGTGGSSSICILPAGQLGSMHYDYTNQKMKFCNGTQWVVMHPTCAFETSGACTTEGAMDWDAGDSVYLWCNGTNWIKASSALPGSISIGDTCNDATIYAGLSTDGSVPMYTTPCDAGQVWNGAACTGTALTLSWDDGVSGNNTTTSITDSDTGAANTASLITLDSNSVYSGRQLHEAAEHCASLSYGGYSDWYLPAQNELNVLYTNRVAIGNFTTSAGTYYWSSTESSASNANRQNFNNSTQDAGAKDLAYRFRCVQKH